MRLTLDYETRSEAELRNVGGSEYARHPSTEIICLGYKIEDEPTKLWFPVLGESAPIDLQDAICDPEITRVAHNAFFEQSISHFVLPKYLSRPIADKMKFNPSRWKCTAAKARASAFPGKLEQAVLAARLPYEKDMVGHRLMLLMCKPKKSFKLKGTGPKYVDDPDKLERLGQYCMADVEAEYALDNYFPDLSPSEREVWLMDQRMNWNGVHVDRESCRKILNMIEAETLQLKEETSELTLGIVLSATQRNEILDFVESEGLKLPDLRAGTVKKALLDQDMSDVARRLLEIRQAVSRTSTAKYKRFLDRSNRDDARARDLLVYHGPSTGRWCIDGGTEVLTPAGWVNAEDYSGEPIMQWAPDSKLSWCLDPDWNTFETDKLIGFESRFTNQMVTPEHKLPAWSKRGVWSVAEAKNLYGKRIEIPLAGKFKPKKVKPKIQTQVLVMAQADGHFCTDTRQGRQLRFHFRKAHKIKRCRQLLTSAKIPFKFSVYTTGTTLVVPFCDVPAWLWSFSDKTFGPWLFDHCPETFMSELKFWDSHCPDKSKAFEYSTCNQTNAGWVQTMAGLCGWSARITLRRRAGWNTSYRVFIRPSSRATVLPGYWKRKKIKTNVYCPTTETGFFMVRRKGLVSITGNSGSGIQPQNFPRGTIKDTGLAIDVIADADLELVRLCYEDPMLTFSSCLRGMITATPGKTLYVADYNAIETRVLWYLADNFEGLRLYREGLDPYCEMASKVFKRKVTKSDFDARQLGKKLVLGAGYGLGWKKFKLSCEQDGMDQVTDKLAAEAIAAYREFNEPVTKLWSNLERAAILACMKNKRVSVNRTTWFMDREHLICVLPSGRRLTYPFASVKGMVTPWGEVKPALHYFGVNSYTRKWVEESTYGGKLTENIVQAVSRDCMVEGMRNAHGGGYEILLTVHDEIVSEAETGTVQEFEKLITTLPDWGKDIPLKAEGFSAERYRK